MVPLCNSSLALFLLWLLLRQIWRNCFSKHMTISSPPDRNSRPGKIYLSELFSSKRLESYEYIRVEEMRAFMSRLFALSGKPVVLKERLSRVTLSVISRTVLGKKYFSESKSERSIVTLEEFKEMLDELFLLNGVFNIGDWIPWLRFLDLQGYERRMKALKKRFDRFHDHVLDEHMAKRKAVKDFVAKDMVDLLLELRDNPDLEVKLTCD